MIFDWNTAKNVFLKKERGISFERILVALEEGKLLAVFEHFNQNVYPDHYLHVLDIDGYAWIVPYRDESGKRILITAFPSRKYTQMYLRKER